MDYTIAQFVVILSPGWHSREKKKKKKLNCAIDELAVVCVRRINRTCRLMSRRPNQFNRWLINCFIISSSSSDRLHRIDRRCVRTVTGWPLGRYHPIGQCNWIRTRIWIELQLITRIIFPIHQIATKPRRWRLPIRLGHIEWHQRAGKRCRWPNFARTSSMVRSIWYPGRFLMGCWWFGRLPRSRIPCANTTTSATSHLEGTRMDPYPSTSTRAPTIPTIPTATAIPTATTIVATTTTTFLDR